jgi:hypothetical protein
MKVTATAIKGLRPCKDRLDNYINHYGEKVLTKRQFMGLKNITHEDKLWVAFRLMPKDNLKLAAADIAELVLHLYENKYPNDSRPRLAIEAARKGVAAQAVYDAANDAAFAVYDASRAAFAAARAAAYAAHVDANSATANAAAYAHEAADAAQAPNVEATKSNVQKQIRTICLKYWKE